MPKGMIAWLSSFKDHNLKEDMLHLCQFAYEARASPYMKELTWRSEKGSGQACMHESNASNFLKVRHYIGRLGSHMKAARTLVAAAMKFPTFFDGFEIECLPSPKPAERPPPMDDLTTLDGIAVRMLPKDDKDVLFYQKELQDMDSKFQIYQRLVEEYEKSTFLPRVHAELILLEHFYMHKYDFVDGDKYISCSKPACYCCYHYICAHPGNFVRPASHNKVYLNWRPPDVIDDDAGGSAANHQRDIMNDMLKMIRKDVLAQIKDQRGRRHRAQHDSTTGITVTAL
jgi:OTT_1508-like deaminase